MPMPHPASPAEPAAPRDLCRRTVENLERALGHVDSLYQAVESVRSPEPDFPGADFPATQLGALRMVLAGGRKLLARRLAEAGGAPLAIPGAERSPFALMRAALPAGGRGSRSASDRARRFMRAYRSSCQGLCRALARAQAHGDAGTAALVAQLLRELEKQLWLIEFDSATAHHHLPAVALFGAC